MNDVQAWEWESMSQWHIRPQSKLLEHPIKRYIIGMSGLFIRPFLSVLDLQWATPSLIEVSRNTHLKWIACPAGCDCFQRRSFRIL